MASNLDRYRKDLHALIAKGEILHVSMQMEQVPAETKKELKKRANGDKIIAALPSFSATYQSWYSETQALIKQLLPARLADFVRHYEKPRPRKDITYESYRIEDYLQGLTVTRGHGGHTVVGPDAAIPHFRQQLAILQAARNRFDSSLFDIRQLVMADLFDSELEAAGALAKSKFLRAAGALSGVVLEKHLVQVCDNHSLKLQKKNPGIGDLNNALKEAEVIDIPQWRFVQHLGDIRNLCDHDKKIEPTSVQIEDLIGGVSKTVKTLF